VMGGGNGGNRDVFYGCQYFSSIAGTPCYGVYSSE
jgi:hypothetical protein